MISSWKRHSAFLALYIVFTLFMTWPVAGHISTHVAGVGGDPWQTLWRFENEWQNKNLFNVFGGGEPRLVNISVWPYLPLHLAFVQPVAYNLVFLLSFVLSGYFMYLLVKYFTKHDAAAFLAGVMYMFLPFHVAHSLGHFGAMQTQWLPLAILLLFKFSKKASIWNTLGLALVVTLQSWSEHHYLLWLGIFGIVFLVFQKLTGLATPEEQPAGSTSGVLRMLLFSLVIVFAFLPWLPTVRLELQPNNSLSLGKNQTIRFSADSFSFITPPRWHPVWGETSHELFGRHFTGNLSESVQFLGSVPLLLIAFFHQGIPKRQKVFWSSVAAIFFVISLGPRLHVFGHVLPVPLPYALLDALPVFSAVRAVARAGVMVDLGVSVLFGWVLATQLKRPISIGIVLAFILAEFLFLPVPIQSARLSAAYQVIEDLPGKSLVEIPAATNYTVASQALYASLVHGKNIVGSLALERAEGSQGLKDTRSIPGLRQLLFLRTKALLESQNDPVFSENLEEALRRALRDLDVHAIAVHVDSLSGEQRKAVAYFLEERLGWMGKKYDDIVLYQIP